jgi:hypothetical protein
MNPTGPRSAADAAPASALRLSQAICVHGPRLIAVHPRIIVHFLCTITHGL